MGIAIPTFSNLLGKQILVYPSIWPGCEAEALQPGDLKKFAPHGCGFYGYQGWDGTTPFSIASQQDPACGVIYFENSIARHDFESLMRIFNISLNSKKPSEKLFAAFVDESKNPGVDGYLVQMRIVSMFGLSSMFRVIDSSDCDNFPSQKLIIADSLWDFIEHQCERWGTSFTQDTTNGLGGLFGGDGHYAREELNFGFMVENSYYGIYRIWSRAWLVTK